MTSEKTPGTLTITAAICLALSCAAQVPEHPELASEPALMLVQEEPFEGQLGEDWTLPKGWTQAAAGDGIALHVAAAQAGLASAAEPEGVFGDVVVDGEFTFFSNLGAAQFMARASAAGSYVAQLDAAGRVTLEKRDGNGATLGSWHANAEPQTVPGAARRVQLSAMGGALRVTVDEIDVLTVNDTTPLPPGANMIGAIFSERTGVLIFDNYAVWAPSDEDHLEASAKAAAPSAKDTPASQPSSKKGARGAAPPPGAPDNDMFADREIVTVGRYHHATNTPGATLELDEPVPTQGTGVDKTVWYEFTPSASGQHRFTTFGSNFNTVLAVYSGTGALSSLTEVASSNDITGSQQAQLTLSLTAAQTYFIQVGGHGGASGDLKFFSIDPADALVPSTPVISSSATGAPSTPVVHLGRTNNLQPVVAWSPRPTVTPYAYMAQLSTVSNFSTILASSGAVTEPTRFWEITPALSAPLQPAGLTYYWRVTAMNFLGQASTFSPAYSFTLDTYPPLAPVLVSPASNGVVTTLRPTLTWKAVADANLYRVRIATDSSGSTPYPGAEAEVAALAYTPSFNIPQGEYWYCVEARDAAGNWSGFGEKRRFVINVSLTPANGANIIASPPLYQPNATLTWAAVAGASYNLHISMDPSFSSTVLLTPVAGTSYTAMGLPVGKFYWRVAVNGQQLPASLARSFNVTPALPVAPLIQTTGAQLGAVTSAGFTNDQTPVFDWTVPANWASPPAGSSVTYELQLSTNSTFTQLVAPPITGITDSHHEWTASTLPLTANTVYYWRVRAITDLGLAGTFSPVYSFTHDTVAPAAPVLTSPALNGVVSHFRPTLAWQAVAGGTRYRARIATNFSGTTLFHPNSEGEVTGLSYTPAIDIPQGEYWYCVEARDAAGNWSGFIGEKRRFVVNVALTPANGVNVLASAPSYAPNVVLTWTRITGATYNVQVATDSSFTSLAVDTGALTGTSYTLTTLPMGNYFWRVHVNGQELPMSLARSFNVTPTLPVAPLIQTVGAQPGAVANAGFTNDQTPMLDWTVPTNWVPPPPAQSITYELQLATNSTFTQMVAPPITGIPDSHYEWTATTLPLTPGTIYYWRVRARTNLGLMGAFSAVYRFTVDTQAPVAPVLSLPAANGVVATPRPAFTWKAVPDATRYRIRIANDPGVTTAISGGEVEVAALTFTPGFDLSQGEYWWSVESRDAAGNWSDFTGEKRRFVVNMSLTPANGAYILASAPLYTPNVAMTWTKVSSGSASYRVQVATDANFSSIAFQSALLTGTSTTVTGLPIGTYYWRVLITGQPVLPGTLARTFNITPALPVAPLLQTAGAQPGAVTNNGFTNDVSPVFDWTVPANWASPPAGSTLTYELQFSTNSTFTQLVAAPVTGLTDSHYEWTTLDPPLPAGTKYYWRVRAVTNLGLVGAFSTAFPFTLDVVAPGPTGLVSPALNGVVSTFRPTLTWTAVAGATRYRARIATNFSGSTLFHPNSEGEVTGLSYTPAIDIPQGEYWFCVEARDAAGNWSGFIGEKRRFVSNVSLTPANGANVIASGPTFRPNVTFTWAKITGATYTLQVADDSSFSGTVLNFGPFTGTSHTVPTLQIGTYYWRVHVNGQELPMSLARRVNVTPALPLAPAIQTAGAQPGALINNGVTSDDTPTFDWTVPTNWVTPPSGSSVTYELQVSTNNTFTQLVEPAVTGISTSHYEWHTSLAPGIYYWRVRAVTNLGLAGAYSAVYRFTVN